MSALIQKKRESFFRKITPRIHLILYSLLLVATPFILLQNYLQDAIGRLSHSSFTIGKLDIPWIPVIAFVIAVIVFGVFFSRIRKRHFEAAVAVVIMVFLAQQVADIYFDHDFYELQQNWHYIAYGLFAGFMYRDQKNRNVSQSAIMLKSFCFAFCYSTLDETFQYFMSNRIFDVGDIAKDVWGCLIGLTVLNIGYRDLRSDLLKKPILRHKHFFDYFRNPFTLLVFLIVFGFVFLLTSSLLTEHEYIPEAFLIPLFISGALFLVVFLTAYDCFKKPIFAALILLAFLQSLSIVKNYRKNITFCQKNLVVYKGVPLPVFDVIVFPNGMFRFVDKKRWFSVRDKQYLLRIKSDIILIGTGFQGTGGLGFPSKKISQFLYNGFSHQPTQLILMRTPDACRHFNLLKSEGKNVLLVLHQDGL